MFDNENDDMTFVSPALETGKHTDERRTDNENDDMTFALSGIFAILPKNQDLAEDLKEPFYHFSS
jgi:hypothetical protein